MLLFIKVNNKKECNNMASISNKVYFTQLPDDVIRETFSHLDGQSVIQTARVSKTWRDNQTMITERQALMPKQYLRCEAIFCKSKKYPRDLIQVFLKCGRSIRNLPVLDISHKHIKSYIDYLMPSDMTSPIMRFTDRLGQEGFAFHLVGIGPGAIDEGEIVRRIDGVAPLKGYEIVLAIFRRSHGPWVYAWGRGNDGYVKDFYIRAHDEYSHVGGYMACPGCPFTSTWVNPAVLFALMTGQDRFFRLGRGEDPQKPLSLAVADANLNTQLS